MWVLVDLCCWWHSQKLMRMMAGSERTSGTADAEHPTSADSTAASET